MPVADVSVLPWFAPQPKYPNCTYPASVDPNTFLTKAEAVLKVSQLSRENFTLKGAEVPDAGDCKWEVCFVFAYAKYTLEFGREEPAVKW